MYKGRRGLGCLAIVAAALAASTIPAFSQTSAQVTEAGAERAGIRPADEVSILKQMVVEQQKQIEQLRVAMTEMKQELERKLQLQPAHSASLQTPNLGQVASLVAVIPADPGLGHAAIPAFAPVADPGGAPAPAAQMEQYTKTVDALSKGLAGFKFSGDLRYRFDGIWRAANSVGSPQQNVRERYRLRFNVDKAVSNQLDTHIQLGSGVFNNPLTFDTDFAGANNRGPIFISEWWADYHPNKFLDLRGGKMPEVFADNSRFFYDDDLRLNGFQETGKVALENNAVGLKSIALQAGQYILTNPNVQVLPSASACTSTPQTITVTTVPTTVTLPPPPAALPAACAYLAAGFAPGGKVRDTNLFDQGIALAGDIHEGWSHQFITNFQVWRNPNGLQLASLSTGFPLLVNGYYGVAVSSGPPETGTATTTKGGAMFTAADFQVGRINYRITHSGWKTSRQGLPAWVDLQASRNFGAGFARNAWMATLSVGEVKKFGDLRFLYQYAYKDANSMISQVTDDDLGTGTGVNLRTHGIRVDLGLNKFLEFDNKLFIQDPVRGNDPARKLFVPVPAGVNTSYRIQSEFNVKF